jgi:hypothetical protein
MDTIAEAGRWLEGYGLAHASLEHCVDALTNPSYAEVAVLPGGHRSYQFAGYKSDLEQALTFLNFFTPPVVRHLLVQLSPLWTLCLNNSLPNSSFADDGPSLAKRTRSSVFRVVDNPSRIWKRDDLKEVMSWEARIFTAYRPDGTDEKTILAMNDGGQWKWFATPNPQYPIEQTFDYNAKSIKKRFTSENLRSLLGSLGAPVPGPEAIIGARRLALLQSPGQPQRTITRQELDDPAYGYYSRGMTWVPHMATHATSVIHDFEKALRINPIYEPKVRPHIDEAKRILRANEL